MILNPESAPEERVNFVGHCIYCGVTGDVAELGDGHVAPAGLMGVFILTRVMQKTRAGEQTASTALRALQRLAGR